jgi:hypothetical protein
LDRSNSGQLSSRSVRSARGTKSSARGQPGGGSKDDPNAHQVTELEEQLGDALYRRAEAKLMVEDDVAAIAGALQDSLKVLPQSYQ